MEYLSLFVYNELQKPDSGNAKLKDNEVLTDKHRSNALAVGSLSEKS